MNLVADTPPMRRAQGQPYLDFMADMHQSIVPAWYLEIGTQRGKSLELSNARSVAIDPGFMLTTEIVGKKPEVHLFQETSDDFFANGHLKRLGAKIDLAFLDGMHQFEYLLRDFMNTERFMSPEGVILLHDCVPWNEGMTAREQRDAPTADWTGDVWKVVPILQSYRPDLKIEIYDCKPTGLVAISNLNSRSRVLKSNYTRIVAEFAGFDGFNETVAGFELIPATKSPWRPKASARKSTKLTFAVQLPVPRPRGQTGWGDYHYGVGLVQALERKGCAARVQTKKHWEVTADKNEIDIVIRGLAGYKKRPGHRLLYWLISEDGSNFERELADADHIFAAGLLLAENLSRSRGSDQVSFLPQAFDPSRMKPPEEGAPRSGLLFVGISRRVDRPMVQHALATETEIELWGSGWDEGKTARWFRGDRIENHQLGAHYAGARIVLNDHKPSMRAAGLTSNRIFDALACATPVISDRVAWMPEEFRDFVEQVDTPEEFRAAIERIDAEGATKKKARRALALKMRDTHSFDARAEQIIQTVRGM